MWILGVQFEVQNYSSFISWVDGVNKIDRCCHQITLVGNLGLPPFEIHVPKQTSSLHLSTPKENLCSFWLETLCQVQKKLRGDLLFPEEKWLFFSIEGRKTVFSKGNKCSSRSFFAPGIMFFSLKDTFSCCFILWPTISLYIWIGSVSYFPYRFR